MGGHECWEGRPRKWRQKTTQPTKRILALRAAGFPFSAEAGPVAQSRCLPQGKHGGDVCRGISCLSVLCRPDFWALMLTQPPALQTPLGRRRSNTPDVLTCLRYGGTESFRYGLMQGRPKTPELAVFSHTSVFLLLGFAFPPRIPQSQMDHVLGSTNNSDQGPQVGGECS